MRKRKERNTLKQYVRDKREREREREREWQTKKRDNRDRCNE